MAKFNKNWMKQLSESYIWEMQNIPPMFPPGGDPSPQPQPQPAPKPIDIPPMEPPQPRPSQRMGQWRDPNPRNPRRPGRGGRTTGAERGQRNPPMLPPSSNINWANIWRQYSGSGYNNEILQGLFLQAQRAGYTGQFGDFYATLVAQYGGNK